MSAKYKFRIGYAVQFILGIAPMIAAIYLLYWLGKSEVWVPETPHRDKITIVIVALGMGVSFMAVSRLLRQPGSKD